MLAISGCLAVLVATRPLPPDLDRLESGWEYRWSNDGSWKPIEQPINPTDRNERSVAFYRIQLPEYVFSDPALFVYSIDVGATFKIDGREIYAYGDMENGKFTGWPWHLIDLDASYSGGELTVEVVSHYVDIGLFGDILIGERASHIGRLYSRDMPRIIICAISIVVAILFFGIYLAMPSFKAFLFFAGCAVALAIRVFSLTLTRQLLLDAPLLWEYIRLSSYMLVPMAISLSVGEIAGGVAIRITKYVTWFYCVVLAIMIVAPLAGLFPVTASYGYADVLAILTLILVASLSLYSGAKGNLEAFFVSINFLVVGLFAVYSILMFSGKAPWSDEIDYIMLFQLNAGLLFVLVRRFIVTHRALQKTNITLEQRVRERTDELEQVNRELERDKDRLKTISITDGLTGVRNRAYVLDRLESAVSEAGRYNKPLSVILFDIDEFKKINDEYGHQAGDRVLVATTQAITGELRGSDVLGRYGGEEFLAVLPGTGLHEAAAVAERIRSQVDALVLDDGVLGVTVSGGVADFRRDSADGLLKRADICLYEAKAEG